MASKATMLSLNTPGKRGGISKALDPLAFQCDLDLWFDDGSVVIVAQETGYCVHKSLLSRRSPVFRDAFSEPTSSQDGASNGSRLHMYSVAQRACDMKCLLQAIYDGERYLKHFEPSIPFGVLSALMRLGHQHQMPDIVCKASCHLQTYFVSDFTKIMGNSEDGVPEGVTFAFSDDRSADVIEAVNLARLTGENKILPLALYHCCQLPLDNILHGVTRENGDVMYLSPEDTDRCLRAREAFLRDSSKLLCAILSTCPEECTRGSACSRCFAPLSGELAPCLPNYLVTTDVLAPAGRRLDDLRSCSPFVRELCRLCKIVARYQIKSHTWESWGGLLKTLDLSAVDLGIEWLDCDLF